MIFRRTTTQITNPGGLWDESAKLYIPLGSRPVKSPALVHTFPSGMKMQFAHLEHESNIYDWQGAQVGYAGFDELTHFTRKMFFYMLSRLRTDSGAQTRVRATMNADADSWVALFIAWWINPETGFAIPERSGVIRYFLILNDEVIWADTAEELIEKYKPEAPPLSFTFIPAKLEDNPILLSTNKNYLANLLALPLVERERLRGGNWKIRAAAGLLFQRSWFKILDQAPVGGVTMRYWDRAATEKTDHNDPANTAGLKLKVLPDGRWIILHVEKGQWSPGQVEERIKNLTVQDGKACYVGIEQDPGQAGIVEATQYTKLLAGYNVKLNPARKDKVTRALPVSAQAEAGNICLLRGDWNEAFLSEAENFPDGKKKDQVDALSGAFAMLLEESGGVGALYVVSR